MRRTRKYQLPSAYYHVDGGDLLVRAEKHPSNLTGMLRCNDGGYITMSSSTLDADITTSGDGGLNDGTTLNGTDRFMYVYAVPSQADGNIATLRVDETGPISGGPSGYSTWRYITPIFVDSGNLLYAFRMTAGFWQYYASVNSRALFDTGGTFNPTDDSWTSNPAAVTITNTMPETVATILCYHVHDNDPASPNQYTWAVDPDGTPAWAPGNNVYSLGWFVHSVLDHGVSIDTLHPVFSGNPKLYMRFNFGANADLIICVNGFTDGWLIR